MDVPENICKGIFGTTKQLLRVKSERKSYAIAVRAIKDLFGCDSVAAFLYKRSSQTIFKVSGIGEFSWDSTMLIEFFHNRKPHLPPNVLMAPLRRGNQVVGVVGLYSDRGFQRRVGKLATEVLRILGMIVGMQYMGRISSIASRLFDLYLSGKKPKDLCYRTMHELRRLIDYDHGASLILREGNGTGRIVARQVAWRKGKSDIVGRLIRVNWALAREGGILVLDLPQCQADLINLVREEDSPPKRSCLVGYLKIYRDNALQTIGCIELGSKQKDFFLDSDSEILQKFIPVVTLSSIRLMEG